MKTLAQIRAANALQSSKVTGMGRGQEGGNAISGFPMLIKTDGLLAAIAFSLEANKGRLKQEGANHIITAIAKHLSSPGILICEAKTARDLVDELASGDAHKLRRATAEALSYLSYLKRFVA